MLSFLRGGGLMGAALRAHDWDVTPLGPAQDWPTSLKTLVSVMLGANQPMFVVWGPEQVLLYNDSYKEILADKHPGALGRPFLEVWSEIGGDLRPIVDKAYSGEAVHMDDIELILERRGYPEETHFSFSYTPIRGTGGTIDGFFCPCTETTAQVLAERRREVEADRQMRLFEQAPGFIAVLSGPDHRFQFANQAYRRLIGGRDVVGKTARQALPELADQPFFDLLDRVYTTGQRHVAHDTPIWLERTTGEAEERFLDFIYEAVRDEAGRVTGIFVEGHDVTDAHQVRNAVRQSEERLRLIIDGARDYAILTMNENRRITGWSAGAEAAFRLSEKEAIGRSVDDLFVPEDVAAGAPEQEAGTALATGCAPDLRWHQRADGSLVFINGSTHALPAGEGRPRELLKIGRDETDQRRREEELSATRLHLERSEERFRTALQIETVGAIFFDQEGRIFDANEAFLRMGGFDRSDLKTGKLSWQLLTPSEWLQDSQRAFEQLHETGSTIPYEKEYIRKDGSRWWALFAAKLLPDGTGFEFVLDITDRKKAEGRLRELNEQLERRVKEALAEQRMLAEIVESTDVIVAALDQNYNILAGNHAFIQNFERLYGVRPKLGDNVLELLVDHPEEMTTMRAGWDRALAGEEFTSLSEFVDPAADRRMFEAKFCALRNEAGERIGAYQFATDVTDRLRAEAELSEAQDALRQSQKMEAVGQLTGGVAHDFNNLLTIIKGSTELLRRPDLPEAKRGRYVEAISQTVDRAAKLTGQLLAFARRQALKPEIFDVVGRIRGISDMLRTIMGSRVQLVTQFNCEPCFVEADASQFETALVNMAVNARDAMEGEGTLTLRITEVKRIPAMRRHAASSGPYIAICVDDTGSGIPADQLSQIFEPFFTTKEVGRGTGLGLSQVFGFAKQSNGNVQVESTPGEGSTFTLYLPRAEPADGASTSHEHAEQPAPVGQGAGQQILVVEDNVDVGSFSTQMLQDLGYRTLFAGSPSDALELLAGGEHVDLVFSDVVMPGMSGVDLGREIRSRYPDLPVVLTSGYSHILVDEGRHGFELLQKPYAAEDLSRVLQSAFRTAGLTSKAAE